MLDVTQDVTINNKVDLPLIFIMNVSPPSLDQLPKHPTTYILVLYSQHKFQWPKKKLLCLKKWLCMLFLSFISANLIQPRQSLLFWQIIMGCSIFPYKKEQIEQKEHSQRTQPINLEVKTSTNQRWIFN